MESLIKQLIEFLSIEFTVVLTAALPVIELRGAIPVGISLGLTPIHATMLSLIGSMIPVPFILFGIRPVLNYLKHTKPFRKLAMGITDRSINNNGHKIQKYGAWGLILIVALPLPGTGVWSGSLLAALLDIRFKWAFPAILFGNILAAIIIMCISQGFLNILT
ncbi:MAG: small multi-drug export protein [Gudongella sp.]|nr:small multi-drug export protein [Gudongella sp.]